MNSKFKFYENFTRTISRILVFCLFFIFPVSMILYAQEVKNDKDSNPPAVQILGSKLFNISSSIVGQEYDIYVSLPGNYKDTTKTFPVVYLVDGQWDFSMVTAIYGQQYYDGFVPGIIIVGITWGGKNPNYDSLRGRDLTPTHMSQTPQSGNAPKFLEFIKKELIPFIESKFRTAKNERILIGSSFGGLFTLFALFNETDLFNRYILTSPSVWWDNQVTYKFEKNYYEKKSELPVKLFMAIGEFENIPIFQSFINHLKQRNYKNLELMTRVIEGAGHSGNKAEGYCRGLQFVFARPSLQVNPNILEQYVGIYKTNSGIKVKILVEDGKLMGEYPGGGKVALLAESDKDFYIKGQFTFIHFKSDTTGKITGFQLELYQGEEFVKKEN